MEQDIKRAMARARGYWYEDGISEAVTGVLLLLIGGLFFIEAVSPPESLPQSFSAIGLPILLISGFFIAGDQMEMSTSSAGAYGAVIAVDQCDPADGLSPVDRNIIKNPSIYYDPNAQAPFTDIINNTLWLEYAG